MGPGFDLQQLMQQAQQMQEDLAAAEVTGTAGGGLVAVTMSGTGQVKSIKIDPSAVDPADVETLEDLVVAAVHAASAEQARLAGQTLGPLAGGLPGMSGPPGLLG